MSEERQRAEREAWDEVATHSGADLAAFEEATSGWQSARDALLGGIDAPAGARVLDCGCGEGALTREAAQRGWTVTSFDISGGMLANARRVTTGLPVALLHAAFESLPFRAGSFQGATGMFVLHHVELGRASRELARVLAPGARATFIETWQRNPLIRFARRLRGRCGVAQWGTDDERPLQPSDLRELKDAGFGIRLRYPAFVFFRLLDNNVFRQRWRPVTRFLAGLDRIVGRIPGLRALGYYCVIEVERLPDAA